MRCISRIRLSQHLGQAQVGPKLGPSQPPTLTNKLKHLTLATRHHHHPHQTRHLASSGADYRSSQLTADPIRLSEPVNLELTPSDPPVAGHTTPNPSQPHQPSSHQTAKVEPFRLRPYQLDCIEAVLRSLRDGYSRIGVSAPTGSGKTAMFTSLIHRMSEISYPDSQHNARRVMILVGAIELATQARDAIKRRWPDLVVEIEQGSKNKASGHADVTVATYQTLIRGGRLDKYDPREFKAVIVDEAHHAAAQSYLDVLAYFNSSVNNAVDPSSVSEEELQPSPVTAFDHEANSPSVPSSSAHTLDSDHVPEPAVEGVYDSNKRAQVPILGFTATFGRADGLALGKVFQTIAWHSDWLEMIRGSWLSQLQFTTVKLGDALDMSKVDVSSATGEFNQVSLAAQVDRPQVTDLAVQAWLSKASDRRSTIVFAINIAHIYSIVDHFQEVGVDARYVHEGVKTREREATLQGFRNGDFPVLVNCGILTEGADFPAVDCILLARPTKSANLFIQMLGRGLRLSPATGKTNCLVLDLVGSSVKGLACTPTLFGIDPDQAIEDQSTDQLEVLAKERPAVPPPPPEVTQPERSATEFDVEYTEYNIFDLVDQQETADSLTAKNVRTLSQNAWIGVGGGRFVLELMGNYAAVARAEERNDLYRAQFFERVGSHYSNAMYKTHLIGTHHSLPILLRTADAFTRDNPKANPHKLDLRRAAKWRQGPMSDNQRLTIMRRLSNHLVAMPVAVGLGEQEKVALEGVWLGRGWKELVDVDALSRGDAADVLTRALHGGMNTVTKERKRMESQARKQEKVMAKQREKEEKAREKAAAKKPAKAVGFATARMLLG